MVKALPSKVKAKVGMKKAAAKGKAKAAPGRKLPRSAGGVVPTCGLAEKGQVLEDGGETYDVDLNLSDAAKNMNKFYRMQVVEAKDGKKHWFVQHWGRIGTTGQTKVTGFGTKEAAVKALRSKFRQKAGVDFDNRGAVAPGSSAVTGKYELTARLKAAGAKMSTMSGAVAISLMWDHSSAKKRNDLDLHVTPPSGEKIWFRHKKSKCGGELDVDMTQGAEKPVENIVWTKQAPKGTYKVAVNNFFANHSSPMPFQVGIVLDGGEMELINKTMPGKQKATVQVKKFAY